MPIIGVVRYESGKRRNICVFLARDREGIYFNELKMYIDIGRLYYRREPRAYFTGDKLKPGQSSQETGQEGAPVVTLLGTPTFFEIPEEKYTAILNLGGNENRGANGRRSPNYTPAPEFGEYERLLAALAEAGFEGLGGKSVA